MPRRPYKWRAVRLKRSQLHVTVHSPRWFESARLATLHVALLDVEGGPKRVETTVDIDQPVPDVLIRQLSVFCGGVMWAEEIAAAIKRADLEFPPVVVRADDSEYEVVWSGSLEAAGQVPGLATAIPSSWDLLVAELQAQLVAAVEPCPVERVEAIRRGISASRDRTADCSDAAILLRLRKGFTFKAIAEHLGVSYNVVARVAKQSK